MYENTLELAENKLLLLYIIYSIKLPISNNQLTQIILENNFINYFTLQQYLSELESAGFTKYTQKDGKQRLIITDKGSKVLIMFKGRISAAKISVIDSYLDKNMNQIKNETTVISDYTIEKDNNFIVNLKVTENDQIIIDLKINVPSKKHAMNLCSKWKEDSSQIYNDIMNLLFKS